MYIYKKNRCMTTLLLTAPGPYDRGDQAQRCGRHNQDLQQPQDEGQHSQRCHRVCRQNSHSGIFLLIDII